MAPHETGNQQVRTILESYRLPMRVAEILQVEEF